MNKLIKISQSDAHKKSQYDVRLLRVLHRYSLGTASALTELDVAFERLCRQQSIIVSADSIVPEPFVHYDGSAERRDINQAYSLNASYIELDVLSLTFLCNEMFRDTLAFAIAAIWRKPSVATLSVENVIRMILNSATTVSWSRLGYLDFLEDVLWLDANLRVPCELAPEFGWNSVICGYHASVRIGASNETACSAERYERLYRRFWPGFDSYFEGSKHLVDEFAKPQNFEIRSKFAKYVKWFGYAPAGLDVAIVRLLVFHEKVFDSLDRENPAEL